MKSIQPTNYRPTNQKKKADIVEGTQPGHIAPEVGRHHVRAGGTMTQKLIFHVCLVSLVATVLVVS